MPWDGAPLSIGGSAAAMPVAAFAIHGSLIVGTDSGDWLALGSGEQLAAIGATGPMSAAVRDAAGTLTVAGWGPSLAQLRGDRWSEIALASPAVALAATPRGLVIAEASGALSLLAGTSRVPVQELVAGEPVLDLAPAGGGIVALLANGAIASTTWPGAEAPLAVVETAAIGHAHAVFADPFAGAVLVAGARGAGVIERGRLVAVASDLGDRVAGAAAFGAQDRALVYCDDGAAYILDRRLSRAAQAPAGGFAGAAPGDDGRVLAWTTTGSLQAITAGGTHHRLTEGSVVLAAPEVGRIGAIALHWTPQTGVRATRGHVAWT
jgi:hypothetical protein